ncbi:MAG: glycosyltransferase [Actinomycetota bacterium]
MASTVAGRLHAELEQVEVGSIPFERFRSVLGDGQYDEFVARSETGRALLDGRVLWNVNSTSKGGGVAEMLTSLIRYARGAGVDARWLVIAGDDDFFEVTKRIHNRLHGSRGDDGPLDDAERRCYEAVLEENAAGLLRQVGERDVVILHDPQTVGLAGALRDAGATVVWRCHVGIDEPDDLARSAWDFLRPYVDRATACVFSRREHVWAGIDDDRVAVIPPSIDAFSPKNQDLDGRTAAAILAAAGVRGEPGESGAEPAFVRGDGSEAAVTSRAEMIEDEALPIDASAVTQVSRWDRLKDPVGVLRGFAEHVTDAGAHLVLAGPEASSIADDPEGTEALREVQEARSALPGDVRGRVHLACLPAADTEENAAIVNALQRLSSIVVQKSLAEGFGLTVAEAMWKARPMVASRVGGIQDQIEHERDGLLVDDPADLESFGRAISSLLRDPDSAKEMGRRARERVREEFLAPRHLMQYVDLLEREIG